tara:strand:- start:127 stop:252 length:126 start_codon:yes stop_codon:yes gene_type:complete
LYAQLKLFSFYALGRKRDVSGVEEEIHKNLYKFNLNAIYFS